MYMIYIDMVFRMFEEVIFPEDSHYIITIHQAVFCTYSLSQLLNKDIASNLVLHSVKIRSGAGSSTEPVNTHDGLQAGK